MRRPRDVNRIERRGQGGPCPRPASGRRDPCNQAAMDLRHAPTARAHEPGCRGRCPPALRPPSGRRHSSLPVLLAHRMSGSTKYLEVVGWLMGEYATNHALKEQLNMRTFALDAFGQPGSIHELP